MPVGRRSGAGGAGPGEHRCRWPVGSTGDLAAEVGALAGLLAEVVMLAAERAVFPSRLEVVAELAREHDSVRAALRAEGTAS